MKKNSLIWFLIAWTNSMVAVAQSPIDYVWWNPSQGDFSVIEGQGCSGAFIRMRNGWAALGFLPAEAGPRAGKRLSDFRYSEILSRPCDKNISLFRIPKSVAYARPFRPTRDVSADRHGTSGWNAMDAAMRAFRCATIAKLRTTKSCGPGAATVASILREVSRRQR